MGVDSGGNRHLALRSFADDLTHYVLPCFSPVRRSARLQPAACLRPSTADCRIALKPVDACRKIAVICRNIVVDRSAIPAYMELVYHISVSYALNA
jgi:hypothetical protein